MAEPQAVRLLATFETAVRAGQRQAAYEAVRDAWRACRIPELAELVEDAAKVLASEPVGEHKTRKAWREAWLERARTGGPQEAASLLRELERLVIAHQGSLMAACLDELLVRTEDPALTMPACTFAGMEGGAVSFGSWGKVLTRLFLLVESTRDPRAIPALESLLQRARANPWDHGGPSTAKALRERIPGVLDRMRSTTDGLQPSERSADLLERIRSARAGLDELPEQTDADPQPNTASNQASADAEWTEEQLLAAALDAPDDDDAPWAVYADALSQRGDPRGELITLQIAGKTNPKAAKSAQKFMEKHRRAFLGPLASAVLLSTVQMHRGFLSACETDVRRKAVSDTIFSHPGWSTIRWIRFRGYGRLTAVMQRLEQAWGVPESGLVELATITLPRLRVLTVRDNRRGFRALSKARGLPALRSLAMHLQCSATEIDWIFEAPFGPKLEHLGVWWDWASAPADALAAWPRSCRAHSSVLRTLELRNQFGALVLDLEAKRGALQVNAGFGPSVVEGHARAMQERLRAIGYAWDD